MWSKRNWLLLATAVILALVTWDQWRRQPAVQIPATFARLEQAIADHDAADVMACVDRRYDFHAHWPELFADQEKGRSDAQRLLALAFLHIGREEVTMRWTLDAMDVHADGGVQALVTLTVTGGPFTKAMPPLSHHAFLLRRSGWISGYYRIIDHAPFALDVPAW